MLVQYRCPAQAVVVTDPFLVAHVLDRSNEVEKSIDTVYSKFNVVSPCRDALKAVELIALGANARPSLQLRHVFDYCCYYLPVIHVYASLIACALCAAREKMMMAEPVILRSY